MGAVDDEDARDEGAGEPSVLFAFRMPVSMRRRLRLAAAETGRTMGSLAEEAIGRMLDERENGRIMENGN